jgi:LuxR family maltose regulon positive regulatory protein
VPDPLLATKVSLPLLRHPCVPRKEVLKRLSAGLADNHLLTLISAPAGYGKTTTLRLWLEELGRPVAWVRLEKTDNELPQFLKYVLAALQRSVDNLGRTALEVIESAREVHVSHVSSLLINELHALEQPLILVLEDYHLIENAEIDAIIESLLHQAMQNLHLVITTREDPGLSLAHLRVQNQLTEIRAADLRFSLDEALEFFTKVMSIRLSEKQVDILKRRTEGWVAGLQLAALSLKDSQDPEAFISAFRGTHRHVLDYLLEEVLNGQPEEVRSFLRHTSILEQLSASLCEAVSDQKNSHQLLRYLERNNLFLVPLDDHRTWYRYHALFAELLKNQLLQSEPQRWDELQARAAGWYQAKGYVHEAIEHAFQVSDRTLVLRLIEAHAFPMLFQGQVTTVAAWFDRLPDVYLQTAPMLCIGKAWAWVLMQRGAPREEVEQVLHAAGQALDRVEASEELRKLVAGHAASIQAYVLRRSALRGEEPKALIALAQEAERLLPQEEKAIRSANALNIGYGYLALADLEAASLAFKQALEDGLAGGNFYAAIYGPINLILDALLVGRMKEALQLCETSIERFNQILAGQYFPPVGALSVLKGSIFLECDHLAEAERALTEGLGLIRWTGESIVHRKGYTALARLRAIQGDRPAMLEAVKTLEEIGPESVLDAQALRHRLSMRHWPHDLEMRQDAYHWLAQSGIEFAALEVIDRVDPPSTSYFEGYLNAAHVLARLAQGKPGVCPLDDAHAYLGRQQAFATAHGFISPVVEIAIARTLLYQAAGKKNEALETLNAALSAAAPTGLFRLFVDEGDALRALLHEVKPRLAGEAPVVYANRLLEALSGGPAKPKTGDRPAALLSERELEILHYLAQGLTYEEIGRQLFLSLNTIQFHVKNIYGKLLVNKRVQAIEKAREMRLI